MHGRPEVSRLWCIGIDRFIKAAPKNYEVKIIAVVSCEDSAEVCKEFNIEYCCTENKPLGRKFNTGLKEINENYDYDYLILLGDDDLISNEAWSYYKSAIDNKEHFTGFGDIIFYSPKQNEALLFDYYPAKGNRKLIGAGRLLSKEAITRSAYLDNVIIKKQLTLNNSSYPPGANVNFTRYVSDYLEENKFLKKTGRSTFNLWRDNINMGLDHSSEMNLLFSGFTPKRFNNEKPLIVDIKTEVNIWKINHYRMNSKQIEPGILLNLISPDEVNYIEERLM